MPNDRYSEKKKVKFEAQVEYASTKGDKTYKQVESRLFTPTKAVLGKYGSRYSEN